MISFQWDTKEEAKINFSTPFSFWRLSQVIVHLEWNMVRMYLWNMKKRNMKIRLTWPRKIRFDTINYLMIFDKKEIYPRYFFINLSYDSCRLLTLQNLTKVGKVVAGQICWRGGDLRDIYVIMVSGNRRRTSRWPKSEDCRQRTR